MSAMKRVFQPKWMITAAATIAAVAVIVIMLVMDGVNRENALMSVSGYNDETDSVPFVSKEADDNGNTTPLESLAKSMINNISSDQIRSLTPDMTYREVLQRLGGEPSPGAQVRTVQYLVDGKYPYSLFCEEDWESNLFLRTGAQVWESIQAGTTQMETVTTEAKIKEIRADMTYREVFAHLGDTCDNIMREKKYGFCYEVDGDWFLIEFDDPDKAVGYSGEQILEKIKQQPHTAI